MMQCRFDDSLPRMVEVLDSVLGVARVDRGVFLRDSSGRLSFYAAEALEEGLARGATEQVRAALGSYARADVPVVSATDSAFGWILDEARERALFVPGSASSRARTVRYLERRIVGADWLPGAPRVPRSKDSTPVRVAFASLKGGVGRSTALAVVAAELARKGRNVLVIDLDLEAPGVGSLLLDDERCPMFGAIDYLVERNLGPVDAELARDLVGTSALTRGRGLVHVVPAVGASGKKAPETYLAKLSRAMQEAIVVDSEPLGLAAKVREMVEALEANTSYDVVLLDVRAGLAELASAPLLALDAEVLLFVGNQRQSLEDLEYLLAHLSSMTPSLQRDDSESPWRRLKLVHSKASTSKVQDFYEKAFELFANYLYEADDQLGEASLARFNFAPDDRSAPHFPILIRLDNSFADWDPVADPNAIAEDAYKQTFADLLRYVEADLLEAQRAVLVDGEA